MDFHQLKTRQADKLREETPATGVSVGVCSFSSMWSYDRLATCSGYSPAFCLKRAGI